MKHKGKLKKVARIHCAVLLLESEASVSFNECGLTDEEIEIVGIEINRISRNLLKKDLPVFHNKDIVKAVFN